MTAFGGFAQITTITAEACFGKSAATEALNDLKSYVDAAMVRAMSHPVGRLH